MSCKKLELNTIWAHFLKLQRGEYLHRCESWYGLGTSIQGILFGTRQIQGFYGAKCGEKQIVGVVDYELSLCDGAPAKAMSHVLNAQFW